MSSLNLKRACSTKQNGGSSSASENSYWLMTSLMRWRRTKRSCWFASTVGMVSGWAVGLVPVVVRLVGTLDRDVDVRGLLWRERRQLGAERVEVQAGDLLV